MFFINQIYMYIVYFIEGGVIVYNETTLGEWLLFISSVNLVSSFKSHLVVRKACRKKNTVIVAHSYNFNV